MFTQLLNTDIDPFSKLAITAAKTFWVIEEIISSVTWFVSSIVFGFDSSISIPSFSDIRRENMSKGEMVRVAMQATENLFGANKY